MSEQQAKPKQDPKALRKSLLDQLEANKKAIAELSDDELESVAGGFAHGPGGGFPHGKKDGGMGKPDHHMGMHPDHHMGMHPDHAHNPLGPTQ